MAAGDSGSFDHCDVGRKWFLKKPRGTNGEVWMESGPFGLIRDAPYPDWERTVCGGPLPVISADGKDVVF